jgi:hypothetical protein
VCLTVLAAALALAGCAKSEAPEAEGEAPAGSQAADAISVVRPDLLVFDQAMGHLADLEYARAAALFEGLAGRFASVGDRRRAAESLFWLGYCREKRGDPTAAAALYERVRRDYPDTPAAAQADGRLRALAPAP